MRKLILWLFLTAAVWAQGTRLDTLLAWQRRSYPSAVVTSGFYDSRGVSRYRRQAGLHLGYDIAMPYGTPVRAAWPGRVVDLVPWTHDEWGVVVELGDGTRATYGHVHPLVSVGERIQRGQIVARIASDHLDVKMRDTQGRPLDYAALREPRLPTLAALPPKPVPPPPPPPPKGRQYSPEELETIRSLGLWSDKKWQAYLKAFPDARPSSQD